MSANDQNNLWQAVITKMNVNSELWKIYCYSETILDYPPGVLSCFLVQGQNPNMFYNPAKHQFL